MSDVLTEMLVGHTGAVRVAGKFVLTPQRRKIEELFHLTIIGSVVSVCPLVIPKNAGHREMWEGELILIPKRKHNFDKSYDGMRADQILASDFGNPESWGGMYWEQPQ